jgi:hypothetical protein
MKFYTSIHPPRLNPCENPPKQMTPIQLHDGNRNPKTLPHDMPSAVHPHTPKLVAGIAIYTVRLHDTQAGIMFCQGLTTLYCVEFLANDSVPPSTILTRVTKKEKSSHRS